MFMNHVFDMATIVINIKMKICMSVALISPRPTCWADLGKPVMRQTQSSQVTPGPEWLDVLDTGVLPVAFTVMGRSGSWHVAGLVRHAVRGACVNELWEVTRNHLDGEVGRDDI